MSKKILFHPSRDLENILVAPFVFDSKEGQSELRKIKRIINSNFYFKKTLVDSYTLGISYKSILFYGKNYHPGGLIRLQDVQPEDFDDRFKKISYEDFFDLLKNNPCLTDDKISVKLSIQLQEFQNERK